MKKSIQPWIIVIAVIFLIIGVIITAGLFFPPKLSDDKEQEKLSKEEEEKIKQLKREKAIAALQTELTRLDNEIELCLNKFEKIKVQERRVLFFSRLGIGLILIGLDYLYYKLLNLQPREILGELLKLNSGFLALYSFVAFIWHGTPAKFATYLKSQIKLILRWYHRATYTKYDSLLVNRSLTIQIIEALERPVILDSGIKNT